MVTNKTFTSAVLLLIKFLKNASGKLIMHLKYLPMYEKAEKHAINYLIIYNTVIFNKFY